MSLHPADLIAANNPTAATALALIAVKCIDCQQWVPLGWVEQGSIKCPQNFGATGVQYGHRVESSMLVHVKDLVANQFSEAQETDEEMPIASPEEFAVRLTEKFKDESPYAMKVFGVDKGHKYAKVWQQQLDGTGKSVHCFVDREGNVYKAAGWKAPAKGVRYSSMDAALVYADIYGAYLYAK